MKKSKVAMSTYVLEDRVQGIYKIGQTTKVAARLRQLCIPGKIVPLKIYNEDLEKELHTRFADCRVDNPEKSAGGGYTEWFTPSLSAGGKLQSFIVDIGAEGNSYPFYTPHALYEFMEEQGKLRVDAVATSKKLKEKDYYKYIIGRKILTLLGYLFYNGLGYDTIHEEVKVDGPKTFISNNIVEDIAATFTIDIVSTHMDSILNARQRTFGKRMFLRNIDTLYDGTPVYLMITEL